MQRESNPKQRSAPVQSHERELLGLKFDVLVFVAQNLIANSAQHAGLRGLPQCRIIDLCNYLGGHQHSERDLQSSHHVPQAAKDSVGPAALNAIDPVQVHEAAEVASVSSLFRN